MSTKATNPIQLLVSNVIIFDSNRLCDYEVALRDVLHFRKNLKREEWRSIGIHISNRKRQAKESEVIWNNIPFEAKKVRKELLRNSQPKSGLIRKGTFTSVVASASSAGLTHFLTLTCSKSRATSRPSNKDTATLPCNVCGCTASVARVSTGERTRELATSSQWGKQPSDQSIFRGR